MRCLIAGNWKMNGTMDWIDKPGLFDSFFPQSDRKDVDVLICPPAQLIAPMVGPCLEAGIILGGQNCHPQISGAHTGEISAEMLADAGANFVIVGHSERRAAGETDADVHGKAVAASRAGLTPIICVGETLGQREAGKALEVVNTQLSGSIPDDIEHFIVAYEPVWAIGTGKSATIDDISKMHGAIRQRIGQDRRILYGGSVKPVNAAEILNVANVNGALIGGASLKMESFAQIAKCA